MPSSDRFGRLPASASRRIVALCVAGFVLLAGGALAVVFVLPDVLVPSAAVETAERSESAGNPPDLRTTIPEPAPEPLPADGTLDDAPPIPGRPPSGPPSEADKPAADEARREALKLQAALENAGARDWADKPFVTSYPEAMEVLDAANIAYEGDDYGDAARLYSHAAGKLREIRKNRPERLRQALAQGEAALAGLDTITAEENFRAALVVEPGNEAAMGGLKRVVSLRRAIALSRSASSLQADDRLEEARKTYREAVSADPDYAPARLGLQRVEFEITERRFRSLMSSALAALEANRYLQAERALSEAEKLRPADVGVGDLRKRLDVAKESHVLKILEANARRFEESEDWSKAAEQYRNALKIESTSGFAIAGLARAEKLAELHRQIDFYLDNPGRLKSAEPLRHAQAVVAAAMAPGEAGVGKRLAAKRDKLAGLIAAVRAPVPVTLISDGSTAVSVNRVGRFGAFTEKKIELTPGEYTAVGSRVGFRDVRVTFEVPLRSDGVTVSVRCEEPI